MLTIYSGSWSRVCQHLGSGAINVLGDLTNTQHVQSAVGFNRAMQGLGNKSIMMRSFTNDPNVINGLRLGVNAYCNVNDISDEVVQDITIVFFPENDFAIHTITFHPSGKLSKWPEGFCDQMKIDVMKMMKTEWPGQKVKGVA